MRITEERHVVCPFIITSLVVIDIRLGRVCWLTEPIKKRSYQRLVTTEIRDFSNDTRGCYLDPRWDFSLYLVFHFFFP